jgi:hypothetical protein
MDTSIEPALLVHRKDGTTMKFMEHKDGLYVYDARNFFCTHSTTATVSLLNTVASNQQVFTTREIESADQARDLFRKLGRPSQHKFEDIIMKNLIINFPTRYCNNQRKNDKRKNCNTHPNFRCN